MKLIIGNTAMLTLDATAYFVLQAFQVEKVTFMNTNSDILAGEVKVGLELAPWQEFQVDVSEKAVAMQLQSIYQRFYQTLEPLSREEVCLLIPVSHYKELIYQESKPGVILAEIEQLIRRSLFQKKLITLPVALPTLIGQVLIAGDTFPEINQLARLQDGRLTANFCAKAPKEISVRFIFSAIIIAIQLLLWHRITLVLSIYGKLLMSGAFFWTFGITLIAFSAIILLLLVPLVFSLSRGFKDLVTWLRFSLHK